MLNCMCVCALSSSLSLSHSRSIRKRHAANLYFKQIYLIIYDAEQKESGWKRTVLRRRLLNASLNSLVREKYIAIFVRVLKIVWSHAYINREPRRVLDEMRWRQINHSEHTSINKCNEEQQQRNGRWNCRVAKRLTKLNEIAGSIIYKSLGHWIVYS